MKNNNFLWLLLLVLNFTSCQDDDEEQEPAGNLHSKWELVMSKPLFLGTSEVCAKETKRSDMNMRYVATSCQDEYFYDFTDKTSLVTYTGRPTCGITLVRATKRYTLERDKLLIDGKEFSIVLLARDTLILDYCEQNELGLYSKVGMKFARKE